MEQEESCEMGQEGVPGGPDAPTSSRNTTKAKRWINKRWVQRKGRQGEGRGGEGP